VAGVGVGAVCLRIDVSEPERRGDQRRVVLDVRAHDQDVARLERVVVGEQADEHLAQHLDLALRAMAGVHLQAAVVLL
jgi:hypothetical protein